MTIKHTEGYFLTWDVGPEVIEMVKRRMYDKFGEVSISEDSKGIHFFAKNEEGNDEGQTVRHTVRTDGDDKRDQGTDGADGYLGMVDGTRRDTV